MTDGPMEKRQRKRGRSRSIRLQERDLDMFASLAAGRYLCEYGDLSDAASWRRAVFAYNHVESYVNAVADAARDYAARAGE